MAIESELDGTFSPLGIQVLDFVSKFNELSKEHECGMVLRENQSISMTDFQQFLWAFQEEQLEVGAITEMLKEYWVYMTPNGTSGPLFTFYQVRIHVMGFDCFLLKLYEDKQLYVWSLLGLENRRHVDAFIGGIKLTDFHPLDRLGCPESVSCSYLCAYFVSG